jgi:N-acetyl-anhydromuramyl-L-alanine amidase AmpD
MDIGAADIRGWHKMKGWSDIGYHYVIRRNGELETGRPLERAGAHVRGHNKNSVGVCLIGGVDDRGNPEANYTKEQWERLQAIVNILSHKFPSADVMGHNDLYSGKACPCFDVKEWWYG